jgi:polyisoprenoid-binding protein YceI
MSWQIDPAHSIIEFSITHMMIAKVRGRFNSFSGNVNLNENEPEKTTVDVDIDVNSIDTRQQQRDDHLRSADFFNVSEFPTIKFVGRKVNVLDNNHATLSGELTIREFTKPVTLNVEFNGISKSPWGATSAGFSASTKINRKDWDLTWNQTLETGGVLVGDEISVHIELELIKQAEPELMELAA